MTQTDEGQTLLEAVDDAVFVNKKGRSFPISYAPHCASTRELLSA